MKVYAVNREYHWNKKQSKKKKKRLSNCLVTSYTCGPTSLSLCICKYLCRALMDSSCPIGPEVDTNGLQQSVDLCIPAFMSRNHFCPLTHDSSC